MLPRSHTAVVECNRAWKGAFETEPYETAWAREAVFFVRVLETTGSDLRARVQISPDGLLWCDEGSDISIPGEPGLSFVKVGHFGGYLRLAGELPEGAEAKVVVYLVLKA